MKLRFTLPALTMALGIALGITLSMAGISLAADKSEAPVTAAKDPVVRLTTTMGVIEITLNPARAPKTVENFLAYVKAGHYDGTLFHRVMKQFMIQGGGFEPGMKQKPTRANIKNEADNGLKNVTGTVAMARTGHPHSATAQFFINVKDNDFLDHTGKNIRGWGYAVFGKVSKGMDVVHKIENTATGQKGQYGDVPTKDILINKAELLK